MFAGSWGKLNFVLPLLVRVAMEEVCEKWLELELAEEDEEVLVITDEVVVRSITSGDNMLLGKLLCNKRFNKKKVFKAVIGGMWNTIGNVKIEDIEENVMSFSFDKPEDKRKIWEAGPWSFDRAMLILYDPKGKAGEQPSFT